MVILCRILCYILVVFEQDIVFGAYLTLQAESKEDVDVFKKKSKLLSQFGAEILGVQSWKSFILILGRILCYILVIFEQDIVFGAYLTLQAESREDVDVFKQKSWLTINRCCPTPYMSWMGKQKNLTHKVISWR